MPLNGPSTFGSKHSSPLQSNGRPIILHSTYSWYSFCMQIGTSLITVCLYQVSSMFPTHINNVLLQERTFHREPIRTKQRKAQHVSLCVCVRARACVCVKVQQAYHENIIQQSILHVTKLLAKGFSLFTVANIIYNRKCSKLDELMS